MLDSNHAYTLEFHIFCIYTLFICAFHLQFLLLCYSSIILFYFFSDAIIGSDRANQTDIAIAGIPNPPPDIPLLYHPSNAPPPLPPKTKRTPNKSAPPIDPVTPVTAPGYVAPLLEMGFSEQQVDRARRKLKLNSNESIANQSELFKVAEVVPL